MHKFCVWSNDCPPIIVCDWMVVVVGRVVIRWKVVVVDEEPSFDWVVRFMQSKYICIASEAHRLSVHSFIHSITINRESSDLITNLGGSLSSHRLWQSDWNAFAGVNIWFDDRVNNIWLQISRSNLGSLYNQGVNESNSEFRFASTSGHPSGKSTSSVVKVLIKNRDKQDRRESLSEFVGKLFLLW